MKKYKMSDSDRYMMAFTAVLALIGSYFMFSIGSVGFAALLGLGALVFAVIYSSVDGMFVIYGKDLGKSE